MFLITSLENNLESRKCILIKCVLVAFIVFFSCIMLFNGCSVAKADSIDSFYLDYIQEWCECPDTYIEYISSNTDDTWSFQSFDNFSLTDNGGYSRGIIFVPDEHLNVSNFKYNSATDYDMLNYKNLTNQNIITFYVSDNSISSSSLLNKNVYILFSFYDSSKSYTSSLLSYVTLSSYYTLSDERGYFYNSSKLPITVYGSIPSSITIYFNNLNFINSFYGYNKLYTGYYLNSTYRIGVEVDSVDIETLIQRAVEDDRLNITTINDSYDNKELVLDFTDFGTSTNAATYTYSDLSLTYTIDDIEYTLTDIDNYIEQIGDVQGLIDVMAFIPYTDFETFTDYNNVILTNVSFTRTISSAGGSGSESFNILTNYYINKSTSESGMEDIEYSEDVSGDKLSSDTISSKQYLIDFNQGYGLSYTEFQSLDKPDFFEDDAYYVYLSNDGTLSELLDILGSIQDIQAIVSFINNIDDEIQLQESMESYLYNNAYTQTCSMIVFVYIDNWTDFTAGTISSEDLSYYYYVTTYGRLKQVNQQLADLYIDTNQIAVNTKETYNYLKLRLDDFEDKSLNKLDNIISNGSSSLSWLHTIDFDINSGFNSVVNAINNISIPEQDNTDIIDKLSDVISAIDNIVVPDVENELDTPQECIEYYRANIDTSIEDIPLQYRVAYFEGMTLDKLYTYGINSDSSTLLASTSDSDYSDDSIFVIKYFYDTILDVMNNSTMYNNLVNGMNDIGDSSTYFYDMFDTDFDITTYYGFS